MIYHFWSYSSQTAVLNNFVHFKVILSFSFSVLYSYEGSHCAQPQEWSYVTSFKEGVSIYTIWDISTWAICLFPPIYLFIQSFIHISMDSWSFIFYSGLKINKTWFFCSKIARLIHWEFFQLVTLSLWHSSITAGFFVLVFMHFLTFWHYNTPGSSCICPSAVLGSSFLQGVLAPFIVEWY